MARNTRTFKDLDLNFIANPNTGDISRKFDESAIKQAVKNLVMLNHYEKPFHPEIGSQISSLLFEPFTPMLKVILERAIINTITNFEPRVVLVSVSVDLNPDEHTANITIIFKIANTELPVSVEFTLRRTR